MTQYIITEEKLDIMRLGGGDRREVVYWQTKEYPYNPQAEREKVIYSLEYHLPKNFPSIKNRQLAYKDYEEGGESWCSLPESPILEDGDIIQILREGKDGE